MSVLRKNHFMVGNPDVTRYASQLLHKAAVGDRLPTPVDDIVACADLVVSRDVTLSQKSKELSFQFPLRLRSAIRKIVGLVDLREDVIYLNHQILPQKRNFVTLHEVGHKVLPWQRQTYLYVDDDISLNLDICQQFEQEANQFAADVLFQMGRFAEDAGSLPFTIMSPITLAPLYGASAHAAIRRYPHRFPQGDLVMDDVDGRATPCNFEVFTNSYDTFVFIYPRYEKAQSIWPRLTS